MDKRKSVLFIGAHFDEIEFETPIMALKLAAKGLRVLGDSDAIAPMTILLKDENRFVRMMAVRALSAVGGKSVNEALAQALETESDEKVREAITESMK